MQRRYTNSEAILLSERIEKLKSILNSVSLLKKGKVEANYDQDLKDYRSDIDMFINDLTFFDSQGYRSTNSESMKVDLYIKIERLELRIHRLNFEKKERRTFSQITEDTDVFEIGSCLSTCSRLTVKGNGRDDGCPILFDEFKMIPEQRFQIIKCNKKGHENCCLFKSCNSGKYLGVKSHHFGNQLIQTNADRDSVENHWNIQYSENNKYFIESSHYEVRLQVPGKNTANGTKVEVQIKRSKELEDQQFYFVPIDKKVIEKQLETKICNHVINRHCYEIGSRINESMRMDIKGGSFDDNIDMITWDRHGDENQIFQFIKCNCRGHENCVLIRTAQCNKFIGVKRDGHIRNGSGIYQTNSNANAIENHWRIVHVESKFYFIELAHHGLIMDMPNGEVKRGTQPIVWNKHPHGAYNQQFFFIPIEENLQKSIMRRYYP